MTSLNVTADVSALTDKWAPRLRDAFLAAFSAMGDAVPLAALVEHLRRGDVEAALRDVNVDPLRLRDFEDLQAQAYAEGGRSLTARLPPYRGPAGHRLLVLFDARNPAAEQWLRTHSARTVREVTQDQLRVVRQHLEAGMAAGQNPRAVALGLVGYVNPQTRRREGGALGLTSTQEAWCRAYRDELVAGDRAFQRRALRDRRFDGAVLAAISSGRPLPAALVDKMVAAYRSRALKHRADSIARTEAITALNASQLEGMQQAVDRGQVQAQHVTKRWRSAHDSRVRHTHALLDGKSVPLSSRFQSASGAWLAFPGDPDAPAAERVNCRCELSVRVNYVAALLRAEAA